ncbi:PD-(D/E)XK nuclease [Haloarcula californiae tailed virus 1]|uniref:PD-(D/E)XK nuclease n=1 Tax=Haloarcula californiae tailed virus 1 TaxID=1273746 RepID=R4TI04_9CAUD|nr:exonuclease [Haloarcula californiae tailed virus 1]AGM11946.1 PD-(D/E)XK nuclease [Haloarcula californiae tailed virus 1]UBF23074.1 putative Cas4 nuclease [Haloarcula virus HCTV-16]
MTEETRSVPQDVREHPLSASRVKKFAQCPLSWWYNYVKEETRTKPGEGYLGLGNAVHDSIEAELKEQGGTPNSSTLAHRLKRRYREEDPDIPEWMYDKGLKCCDNAAKFFAEYDDLNIREIEAEHRYAVKGSVNAMFNAKMDVTTDRFIIDWKTGNAHDSDGNIRDYRIRDELIQGMVYAGAYLDRYGEYPDKVIFVYLGDGTVRRSDPSQDRWEEMKQYARSLLQAMDAENFPAKTGGHCGFCDYQFVCPAQDHSMADVSYWKY